MVELKAPSLDSIAVDSSPNPEEVRKAVRRAVQFIEHGDMPGALAEIESALSRRHSDSALLEAKGLLLLMLERPQEALEHLDKARASGAADTALHSGRAIALFQLDQLKESVVAFNESLAFRPDDEVAAMRHAALEALLWNLVDQGFASWSGGKPKGSDPPIEVTPGPPISDLIHQMRG
jgi:Flp pilus assembly protein TadD